MGAPEPLRQRGIDFNLVCGTGAVIGRYTQRSLPMCLPEVIEVQLSSRTLDGSWRSGWKILSLNCCNFIGRAATWQARQDIQDIPWDRLAPAYHVRGSLRHCRARAV